MRVAMRTYFTEMRGKKDSGNDKGRMRKAKGSAIPDEDAQRKKREHCENVSGGHSDDDGGPVKPKKNRTNKYANISDSDEYGQ